MYLYPCNTCTYFWWFYPICQCSEDLSINTPWSSTMTMWLLYAVMGLEFPWKSFYSLWLHDYTGWEHIMLTDLYPSKGMHVYNYSRCETHYYSFSQEHHPFTWINRACKFWAEWHWISPEHFPHIKKQESVRYFFLNHGYMYFSCDAVNTMGKVNYTDDSTVTTLRHSM